jgi:hypothetical protein
MLGSDGGLISDRWKGNDRLNRVHLSRDAVLVTSTLLTQYHV